MGKKTAFSINDAGSTKVRHVEECKLIILISLYKAQVQVNQGPPHKTMYAESNRSESGKESQTHLHRGKFPEQPPNEWLML